MASRKERRKDARRGYCPRTSLAFAADTSAWYARAAAAPGRWMLYMLAICSRLLNSPSTASRLASNFRDLARSAREKHTWEAVDGSVQRRQGEAQQHADLHVACGVCNVVDRSSFVDKRKVEVSERQKTVLKERL